MFTWYDNPSMEYAPKVTISFQVVGVSRKEGRYDVEYIHHLLETMHVPSVPLPHLGGAGEPSVFLATRSLVQLDEHSLISNVSRTIPGKCGRCYKHLYGMYLFLFIFHSVYQQNAAKTKSMNKFYNWFYYHFSLTV